MRTHSRRTRPAFALLAVIALVALLLLDGVAAGVALAIAVIGFIAAAIYAVSGESEGIVGIKRDRRHSRP